MKNWAALEPPSINVGDFVEVIPINQVEKYTIFGVVLRKVDVPSIKGLEKVEILRTTPYRNFGQTCWTEWYGNYQLKPAEVVAA